VVTEPEDKDDVVTPDVPLKDDAPKNDFDRIAKIINLNTEKDGSVSTASVGPDYGKRADGTEKGEGYFGKLDRPDGKISTELSIGVELDGKEVEIPSLVPTLTEEEKQYLLDGNEPTEAIIKKAVEHAKKRMAEGKSPFADKQGLLETNM